MTDLWHALDRLENGKRWGRGRLWNDVEKSFCVLGALQAARGVELTEIEEYPESDDPDVQAMAEVICTQYPTREFDTDGASVVYEFNDDVHREENGWDKMRAVIEKAAIRRDEIL